MKLIVIFCILFISESAIACSRKSPPVFNFTDGKAIDHTIYSPKIIFFSIPKINIENIELHGQSDGSAKLGAINCPNSLRAELSLPDDSPYSFEELGIYFRLNEESSQIISIEQTPYVPSKLHTPKKATFVATFNMNKNAVGYTGTIDIEVIAIDRAGKMGESTFVKAKWR